MLGKVYLNLHGKKKKKKITILELFEKCFLLCFVFVLKRLGIRFAISQP